ncbi:MAG TPA: AAA family ATPase [Burkholderiaceae bacterium]|nr:AAA family ATPase [Burkholderiaceae bacterium]
MDPALETIKVHLSSPAATTKLRLARLLDTIETGLVERRSVVRLAVLAALAREHTLLIGPPGTAKSQLARRLHLAFSDARYFERLLTRFTVPEELFGPLSIRALEEDRYERLTAGFLPDASIAFIDEVFKANSAILNALLTLLNERLFDNGAGRQRCPLISLIGATNEVPEDEVGEAFFDRFLVRVSVAPLSDGGFRALLERAPGDDAVAIEAFDTAERDAIAAAAQSLPLAPEVATLLAELRAHLREQGTYVSDRRWVKIVGLLKTASVTDGRDRVSVWDLALVPACTAADATGQARVAEWLAARLGVRDGVAPPRVTRVVEAFEAQLEVEENANDLDYDESGRLRFGSSDAAQALAGEIGDAKGGATALRMTYTRRRRYGERHIRARLEQIDALVARIGRYVDELNAARADLAEHARDALWLDEVFAVRAHDNLARTADALATLQRRALQTRAGFVALPRLVQDAGTTPSPIEHEALAD